jgi:hypothetical protein
VVGALGDLEGQTQGRQISLRVAASYGVSNVSKAGLVAGEHDEAKPEPIRERQAR